MQNDLSQVVLLAGGKGSRLNTDNPKPLVDINGKRLIEMIMDYYYSFGYQSFILLTGYKHDYFEKFFYKKELPYNVKLLYTGEESNTGERIRQVEPYIIGDNFCLSYGDGISTVDLNIAKQSFESNIDMDILVSIIHPPERYGIIEIENGNGNISKIINFNEKPTRSDWINGGFMFCSHRIFNYINKNEIFEKDVIPRIVGNNKAYAYLHEGFWACVDTQKDLNFLREYYIGDDK